MINWLFAKTTHIINPSMLDCVDIGHVGLFIRENVGDVRGGYQRNILIRRDLKTTGLRYAIPVKMKLPQI